jgi:hypothetical protein
MDSAPFPTYLPLSAVAHRLRAGDNVLFRPRPPRGWRVLSPLAWKGAILSLLITAHGRSRYSHAGKLVACHGRWMVAEMLAGAGGGRLVPLRQYLARESGQIDLYRCNQPAFRRQAAVRVMLDLVERRYGYGAVLTSLLLRVPGARFLLADFDDDQKGLGDGAPYCSAAVAWADQHGGGVDPVRELGAAYTEPGDLARSPAYAYCGTLVADDDPRAMYHPRLATWLE